MNDADDQSSSEESLAELLARLAQPDPAGAEPAPTEISARVDALLRALTDAAGAEWPSAEELQQLPPAEFENLARQLSLLIERLTVLRVGLLAGRGRRPL